MEHVVVECKQDNEAVGPYVLAKERRQLCTYLSKQREP